MFSSLTPSTFCHPFVIVFSSTVCIFHHLFRAQKDHTAHFVQPKENNSAVWKKVNVELESAFPIAELQSKHWSPSGQGSRVSTFPVSRAWTFKGRMRPTNQQTFCSKGCSLQTSPEAGKNSRLFYLPALSMFQEWRGGFCSLEAGEPQLLSWLTKHPALPLTISPCWHTVHTSCTVCRRHRQEIYISKDDKQPLAPLQAD